MENILTSKIPTKYQKFPNAGAFFSCKACDVGLYASKFTGERFKNVY